MTDPVDQRVLDLLVSRDGVPTLVVMTDGRHVVVHNIAWGYDAGADHAHITTNVSPRVDGSSVDVFHTVDIESIADAASGAVLSRGPHDL